MSAEIKINPGVRELRKFRRNAEVVYTDESFTREYRVITVHREEPPFAANLLVRRFDYRDGKWRPGTESWRFKNTEGSRRSIVMMAAAKGCVLRGD